MVEEARKETKTWVHNQSLPTSKVSLSLEASGQHCQQQLLELILKTPATIVSVTHAPTPRCLSLWLECYITCTVLWCGTK